MAGVIQEGEVGEATEDVIALVPVMFKAMEDKLVERERA